MKEQSPLIQDVLQRLEELGQWSEELDPHQKAPLTEAIEHLSNVLHGLSNTDDELPQSASSFAPGPGHASLLGIVEPWSGQVEQRLQENEDLLRPLVESINLVFWMRAPETDEMLYVSPVFEKIWGRTRESLYRKPQLFIDAIHPEDHERVVEAMTAHKWGGFSEEYRIVTPDGSVRWIRARTFPIQGPDGRISRIAGFGQDVTEQKRAEEALRATLTRTRERYVISRRIGAARTPEDVLNALRSLIMFADASRATILIFDQVWDDTSPSRCDVLADWRDDDLSVSLLGESYLFEKYSFEKLFSREQAFLISDVQTDPRLFEGARNWLARFETRSLLLFPLITSNQWYGMLTIHFRLPKSMSAEEIDYFEKVVNQAAAAIYNFHLLEAETRARKEAEKANELKLRFLAMISHELRTPLTSIKGFATTLLADDVAWDPNSQRDFIETIDQEADKLTDLIEHLLDLSRLESGTLRIVPEEQPLNAIVNTAMAQLQALTREHDLVITLPEDLPSVKADPQRIAQVLANLVNNATKYSPIGTQITISASRQSEVVRVDVTDQGPGIPHEERTRVFEPFHQAETEMASPEQVKGVGLGLAICKGLVEAQGGRIWIKDQPRPGTTISFTLPIGGSSKPGAG